MIIVILKFVALVILTFVASIYDAKNRRIPNWISLSLFGLWFLFSVILALCSHFQFFEYQTIEVLTDCFVNILTSAVVTFLLGCCSAFCKKVLKVESPLGIGDIKLMLVVSLYLGPAGVIICLLTACLSFCIFVLLRRIIMRSKDNSAPLVPFIFIGILVSILTTFII